MTKEIKWIFSPYSERLNLPTKSGIYAICSIDGINKTILYIGKSINIRTRIFAHSRFIKTTLKEIDRNNIVIGYFLSTKPYFLEKEAIMYYKPKHNCTKIQRFRSDIGEKIITALDGRPVRWLCMEMKWIENEFSLKIRGRKPFTDEDIEAINTRLSANI